MDLQDKDEASDRRHVPLSQAARTLPIQIWEGLPLAVILPVL